MMRLGRRKVAMCFWAFAKRCFSVRGNSVIDMAAKDGELRVFVVAGEVSGDSIASRLMASLKTLSPLPVRFSGVGGSMMRNQGLESLFPMEDIAVMGIWELLPHLSKFRVRLKETVDFAFLFKPHVVLTVDSKGFSFRLLQNLRARYSRNRLEGAVHFHYVAPSFWAWKGGENRLAGLAKFIDHILCILPNEAAVCRANGLKATFVGHPVLEDVAELSMGKENRSCEWKTEGNPEEFRSKYSISPGSRIISVLPGSRLQEVNRMLPIFMSAAQTLKQSIPKLEMVVHVASNQDVEDYIARSLNKWPVPALLVSGRSLQLKYDAFSASQVALCTSGTVAVELQLARLPCIVAYRAHFLTELFIRHKAKIPYISLPNILLDSPVVPEALFQACTPQNLASLLMKLMHDEDAREEQSVNAEKFIRLLYPSGKTVRDIANQGTDRRISDYRPSIFAACTILSFEKP